MKKICRVVIYEENYHIWFIQGIEGKQTFSSMTIYFVNIKHNFPLEYDSPGLLLQSKNCWTTAQQFTQILGRLFADCWGGWMNGLCQSHYHPHPTPHLLELRRKFELAWGLYPPIDLEIDDWERDRDRRGWRDPLPLNSGQPRARCHKMHIIHTILSPCSCEDRSQQFSTLRNTYPGGEQA